MNHIILICFALFVITACSNSSLIEKHPDQVKNIRNAPSFHDQCASGAYGEWAKGFHCAYRPMQH